MWAGLLIFLMATTGGVWMIPSFRIWGYVLHVATNSHSASCISIYALYGPCHPLLNAKLAKNPPDDMFGYIIKRLFQITKGRAHCLADGTEVSHNWCFVIDLIQAVACCTLPYHLSCWLGRTDVISSMPSFCSSEAEGVSSTSLMPQIQLIMARSLQRSHSRFTTMEHSQVNAGLIHLATYTGWEVFGGSDRQEFLELSPGHTASGSNGTVTATTKVTKSDFHIKHGAVDIHSSNSSASNGQRLTLTPVADIVLVATSRLVIPLHFLWTQTYTVNTGRSCTVVLARFLKDITTITRDQELGLFHVDMEPFAFHTSLPHLELEDTLLLGVCNEHQVINVKKFPRHTSVELTRKRLQHQDEEQGAKDRALTTPMPNSITVLTALPISWLKFIALGFYRVRIVSR